MAGEKIASTAGLSMSTMVDPQSGGQTVVLSSVLSLFLISVFLSLDGHLYLIKMVLESYVYLPIGLTLNFSEVSQMGINTFGKMLYLAALISLPVVGGLLLIQGAIGVITRSAPSLNLFSFGFPIALISLFIFLYAGVDPISNAFSDITGMSINLIDNDSYETTYFEFPGDFTTNLKGSRKFLQLSVGVSTQYDEKVMEVVDSHQLALRSEILSTVSDFTEEDI